MKVVMIGGLGNQLFQMAYGHLDNPKQSALQIYSDVHARKDRPFNIDPLLSGEVCTHARNMGFRASFFVDYRIRLIRKIIYRNWNHLLPFTQKLLRTKYENTPFIFENLDLINKSSNRISYGYFQHWKYVERVWNTFGKELCSALDKINLPKTITEIISESVVIHIRQADYRDLEDTFGVLSGGYYENIISKIRYEFGEKKLVVVTDDLVGAKATLKSIKVDKYIGPDELGAWETLKLMTISPILVTANSTLSWWGAYIGSKSGSKVFIPKPWFKDLYDWPGDAYNFPEAQLIDSRFV
jgi:hypothetical protein